MSFFSSSRAAAGLVLALLASTSRAQNVQLDGYQHVGDCNDTPPSTACNIFTPLDPMSRNNSFNTMLKFHLSTTTTITGVRLENVVDLNGKLNIHIQPLGAARVFRSGSLSGGDTWTLSPALVLTPGYYSIWVDGGCSNKNAADSFFYANCDADGNGTNDGDNDFGYSSATLLSAQTSTSRMLNQRRHPGRPADPANDNDADDDYDFTDTGAPYYPDIAEGETLDIPFTIDANRRLVSIEFYRLRDVDSNNAPVSVISPGFGTQSVGNLANTTGPGCPEAVECPDPQLISINLLLLAGTHTLRIQSPAINTPPDVDSFSWDDIILRFADNVVFGTPGFFNAVDPGENAVNGPLRTKIAAGAPALDIVALNSFGTGINTGYTGTVEVTLLNAATDSTADPFNCHPTWSSTLLSTTLTFVTGDNGRKALPAPFFNLALTKAALNIRDTATSATGCSTDKFALRPDHFGAFAVSQATETTAGPTTLLNNTAAPHNDLPRHRAGQPFTIAATALAAGGAALGNVYVGTPDNTLSTTALILPEMIANPSVSAGTWIASGSTRTTNTATYNEVGAFTLRMVDSTFAAVDAGNPGSTAAQRDIVGTVGVGRFIPDHFAAPTLNVPVFNNGCGTFTYAGQPFIYATAAAPQASLTPQTFGSNATTTNYTGTLNKLTWPDPALYTAFIGTLDTSSRPSPDITTTNAAGVTTVNLLAGSPGFLFIRPPAPAIPFDADISITLQAIESDNVPVPLIAFGTAGAVNGIAWSGGKAINYGHLNPPDFYGSELLPMSMPVRGETWGASGGFQTALDGCTSLAGLGITVTGVSTAVTGIPTGLTGGNGTVTIATPSGPGQATVTYTVPAWLLGDNNADGIYAENPTATATFGLFRNSEQRIYQRERVR